MTNRSLRWCAALAVAIVTIATAFATAAESVDAEDGERPGPVVETASGLVRGAVADGLASFQGIPYAAPPSGTLRWHSPQPASPWTGVRDATNPGNRCPQIVEPKAGTMEGNEDCLVLTITAPATVQPDHPRPVMVWLHGAGGGQGGGDLFDARRLAGDGGIVVVTVNYRLGVLANFGYPELAGSGGFGLEDQQAALRWVRDNIAAFGGDPENVTLFGESSGGMNVCAHLASPTAAGLFQRAIIQSGSCLMHLPANSTFPGVPASSIWSTPEETAAIGIALADALACSDGDAIACLRKVPPETLLRQPLASAFGRAAFGNALLPESPADVLRSGRMHPVPVMIGATRDEATFFVGSYFDRPITAARFRELLDEGFGDAAAAVARAYPLAKFGTPAEAWAAVATDAAWVCPTYEAARLLARRVPVYAYEFADRDAPLLFPRPGFPAGAYHGSEVAYLFDLPGSALEFRAAQRDLADIMVGYWSTFARSGDPNGPDRPAWPPFENDSGTPYVQSLAPGLAGIRPVDLAAAHHCDVWDGIEVSAIRRATPGKTSQFA